MKKIKGFLRFTPNNNFNERWFTSDPLRNNMLNEIFLKPYQLLYIMKI